MFALQSPEVEEELPLDGEGAAAEELATVGVLAGTSGVELVIVFVAIVLEDLADPQGPH